MEKKILVFRGGWDGHDPVQTSDRVVAQLKALGIESDIFNNQECLLQEGLADKYAAIIPATRSATTRNTSSCAAASGSPILETRSTTW